MTDTTTLTRYPDRGTQDRALLDELLDEVMVATVSSVVDGMPWSVPTFFARDDDRVLFHGSTGAGLLRHLSQGQPVTLTVHTIDAIVVAHTAFDSSANYRSAVLRGTPVVLPDDERDAALGVLTDRLIPGRTAEVRASTPKELAATTVLALAIEDGSWLYKARSGPACEPDPAPSDTWVGVVPMKVIAQQPVPDAWVAGDVPLPASVQTLVQRHS